MLKILFSLILVFVYAEGQTCLHGYSFVYDRCFKAIKHYAVTWSGAEVICSLSSSGAQPAIIDSCELYKELIRFLHSDNPEIESCWIGAHFSVENEEWIWSNGNPVSLGVPFWGSTGSTWTPEPSNGADENCVMLVRGDRYRFHNENCDTYNNILCQSAPADVLSDFEGTNSKSIIKKKKRFISDISCPEGFELIGNSCFYFHFNASDVDTRASWDEAKQICKDANEGSHLAILDSCDLFKDVVDFITNNTQYDVPETRAYWLGGSDQIEEGNWYWSNSNAMEMGVPYWGTLGDGTPEPSGGESQNCATMYRDDRYYFHDGECSKNAYPLCQLDPIEFV